MYSPMYATFSAASSGSSDSSNASTPTCPMTTLHDSFWMDASAFTPPPPPKERVAPSQCGYDYMTYPPHAMDPGATANMLGLGAGVDCLYNAPPYESSTLQAAMASMYAGPNNMAAMSTPLPLSPPLSSSSAMHHLDYSWFVPPSSLPLESHQPDAAALPGPSHASPNDTLAKRKSSSSSQGSTASVNGDVRPYVCSACPRAFARKHDLQRHVRVHTGDKPYVCLCCKKAFARTDALKRHLRMEDSCRLSPEVQAMKCAGKRRYRNL